MEPRKIREGAATEEKQILQQKQKIANTKNVIYTNVYIDADKNRLRATGQIEIIKTQFDEEPFIFREDEERGKYIFQGIRKIKQLPTEDEKTENNLEKSFVSLLEAREWVERIEKEIINLWSQMNKQEKLQRNNLCDGYTFVEF